MAGLAFVNWPLLRGGLFFLALEMTFNIFTTGAVFLFGQYD